MSNQQYGKATYWDDRYTKDPEIFDWYQVRDAGYATVCRTRLRLHLVNRSSH